MISTCHAAIDSLSPEDAAKYQAYAVQRVGIRWAIMHHGTLVSFWRARWAANVRIEALRGFFPNPPALTFAQRVLLSLGQLLLCPPPPITIPTHPSFTGPLYARLEASIDPTIPTECRGNCAARDVVIYFDAAATQSAIRLRWDDPRKPARPIGAWNTLQVNGAPVHLRWIPDMAS